MTRPSTGDFQAVRQAEVSEAVGDSVIDDGSCGAASGLLSRPSRVSNGSLVIRVATIAFCAAAGIIGIAAGCIGFSARGRSDDGQLRSLRYTSTGHVPDSTLLVAEDAASKCNESKWSGRAEVCGSCRVVVASFGDASSGTCGRYCRSVGHECRGAWAAALPDQCVAVWEFEKSCDHEMLQHEAICSCGERLSGGVRSASGVAHGADAQRHAKKQTPSTTSSAASTTTPPLQCNRIEPDIDYWTKAMLYTIPGVPTYEKCNEHCSMVQECGAWSWGQKRGSPGLTDVCFLKVVADDGEFVRADKAGVISGVKSEKPLCTAADLAALASREKRHRDDRHESTSSPKPSTTHAPALKKGKGKPETGTLAGVVRSQGGYCLTAVRQGKVKGSVQMWACNDKDDTQMWTFDGAHGQLKSHSGLCLAAPQRTMEFSELTTQPCDVANYDQQWDYFPESGILKNWEGICVDAAESNLDGGLIYMRSCHVENRNQQWLVGALDQLSPVDQMQPTGSSLFCFALMMPHTYEQELLTMQYNSKVSLFQCEAYAVYSNLTLELASGLVSRPIDSDLHCKKGGEFGTALNLPIFVALWEKLIADKDYLQHDWTCKVDPDAVFFASRLRHVVAAHGETDRGVYLNNCKFGLHGPVEVFSRNAVTTWAKGRKQCQDYFWKLCNGDCFWGEDLFIDQCLWRVLDVRRNNDYRLLVEDHCAPPKDWDNCEDSQHVSFHPFKSKDSYLKCWRAAATSEMQFKKLK